MQIYNYWNEIGNIYIKKKKKKKGDWVTYDVRWN